MTHYALETGVPLSVYQLYAVPNIGYRNQSIQKVISRGISRGITQWHHLSIKYWESQ